MQNPRSPPSGFPQSPSDIANTLNSDRPGRPTPSTALMQSRPGMGSSHSYSRSSPAVGADQKFPGGMSTPDRYSASSSRYYPQTPTGGPSHSPLALADIRSQTDLHMSGEVHSPNPYADYTSHLTQTSSSYLAPWATYAFDWCKWQVNTGAGKMAICSHLEDPHNFIQILDTSIEAHEVTSPGAPNHGLDFTKIAEATCSYPVTRILWEPPSAQKQTTDLLATSGDHLRLWSLPAAANNQMSNNINRNSSAAKKQSVAPQKLTPLALLSNSKTPEHTAPLTSLDWNKVSPKLIITSSIDTTCTIWDIPTLTAKTQLIAHDKEVFDVRFCAGSVDTFVSCGADGSVRMFDLRSLEHSTIIYEPADKSDKVASPPPTPTPAQQTLASPPPLVRLAASPHDSHLLATFAQDSRIIRILDHRQPGQALLELHGHSSQINCIEWSPTRRGVLASGADDSLVLSWDLINAGNSAGMPGAGGNVNANTNTNANTSAGAGGSVNDSAIGIPETPGANVKGPASSWACDFEVSNLSWSPPSQLTSQGGDWLGVTGGRALWGVKM